MRGMEVTAVSLEASNRMRAFGHEKAVKHAEPHAVFCANLHRHISSMDQASPENEAKHLEMRNQTYTHFIAAHRLVRTALQDNPVLSEFRSDFASLSTREQLQIVGLMHAYSARKCYADSPKTLLMLLDCLANAYDMPESIRSLWVQTNGGSEHARLRAQQIAKLLGRPDDAMVLGPSLHVVDRKILLYLAFLSQEPQLAESIEWELGSSERLAAN